MEFVLGLDIVTLSLIIAILGTVLHQTRTYNGKPLPKILDGILVTIGGSFVATYTILSSTGVTGNYEQMLLILGLIGVTLPVGVAGQKTFDKVRGKLTTSRESPSPKDG